MDDASHEIQRPASPPSPQLSGGPTTHTLMLVPRVVFALIAFWESYQVELQGHYSVARLDAFVAHYQAGSLLQAIAICALTPVPCILTIVLVDVFPLQPPTAGLMAQGVVYWLRTFFSVAVITLTSLSQFYHSSSRLPLRVSSTLLLTVVVTTATVGAILVLHVLVGFPTPFLYQSVTTFWHVMLLSCMWVLWKEVLRTDAEAMADMKRFVWCWLSQLCMIVVYLIFTYVFSTLSGRYQAWFSIFLPVWKLALKIWASYGVFRLEDAATVDVVFSVDVFPALFLSCAMQSSTSTGSGALVVTMLVDLFQSSVAVNYVWVAVWRLARLGQTIDAKEAKAGPYTSVVTGKPPRRPALFRTASIVQSYPAIRDHPTVVGSRHQRSREPTLPQVVPAVVPTLDGSRCMPDRSMDAAKAHATRDASLSATSEDHPPKTESNDTGCHRTSATASTASSRLSALTQLRLQFTRETLRLLHMVEFYVPIEFTEVIVATVYSIYLVIMSHLPNRVYYDELRGLTNDQWRATVRHVATYAALELLSFVLLCLVFRWLLGHSPVRQLGHSWCRNTRSSCRCCS